SDIFDFLEKHRTLFIERYEVASADFSRLRRSLRSIILRLQDDDGNEARDISDRLRMLLAEWLTVPVEFDGALIESLQALGIAGSMAARWGRDVQAWYDDALAAAHGVVLTENPVREQLRMLIRRARERREEFRIYCHRRAASQFESALDRAIDAP